MFNSILFMHTKWTPNVLTYFHYPKDLQIDHETTIIINETCTLLTARNNGLLYSFNTVQLLGWHTNVDVQYIVS